MIVNVLYVLIKNVMEFGEDDVDVCSRISNVHDVTVWVDSHGQTSAACKRIMLRRKASYENIIHSILVILTFFYFCVLLFRVVQHPQNYFCSSSTSSKKNQRHLCTQDWQPHHRLHASAPSQNYCELCDLRQRARTLKGGVGRC